MEVARLESLYTANVSDLERKSTTAQSALQKVQKQATETEKTVNASFKGSQASFQAFSQTIGAVSPKLGAVTDSLAGLGARASTVTEGMSALVASMGPVGIAAAGIAIQLAAVAVGVTTFVVAGQTAISTLFGLAQSAAKFRGELFDMSQQTDVAVETLSGLEVLFRTTGGNLGTMSASLGIFQRNLDEAQDSGSKAALAFKQLGVETFNTEDALRQTLVALSEMPEGFRRTATSLELFGRGGKSFLAVLKEMHGGDLDKAIAKLREMGIVISKEDAVAADKFNDELELLHLRFRALLGKEAIPGATKALEQLGQTLDRNKGLVNAFGDAVALAGLALQGLALHLDTGARIAAAAIAPFTALAGVLERIARATGLIQPVNFSAATGGVGGIEPSQVGADVTVGGGIFRARGSGGGGGGGGSKTDSGVSLLKQLQQEFFNLTEHTRLEEIQERLLEKQFAKTSDQIKKRIMVTAIEIDITRKVLGLTRERYATEESLMMLREREFIQSLTRVRQLSQIERERFATREGQNRPTWMDLGGGSTFGGEPGTTTRSRIATAQEQVLRDREEMRVRQMREVAEDIGFIFADLFDSIGRGWDGLWQNMLNIARNIANRITSDIFTGLFEGLFNVPMGQRSGGISGLISGRIQGRAEGGPVSAGSVYQIHDREFFRPNIGGKILNLDQMQNLINNDTRQSPQTREMMRLFIVDDMRKARELGGRDIVRASRQMRKVGKLVPAF